MVPEGTDGTNFILGGAGTALGKRAKHKKGRVQFTTRGDRTFKVLLVFDKMSVGRGVTDLPMTVSHP